MKSSKPPRGPSRVSEVAQALTQQIRQGRYGAGDKLPREADLVAEFGVSRTAIREAMSSLQAAGLVQTRHGIGTFVLDPQRHPPFRVDPTQLATLRDVIALLELRISVESEAAGLAAQRRTEPQLARMQAALRSFAQALAQGTDAVAADLAFHTEIAAATQNPYFADLLQSLGRSAIPRARLQEEALSPDRQQYLQRVHQEHESILNAIAAQDETAARAAMRTHLSNSRERHRRSQVSAA